MEKTTSAAFADSKPHYELLDGLRGVAALVVMWYHVFEGFATSPIDQGFNHGYLAVDFFFILSGFVIGYAYDDRWKKTLTTREFFKRRLIRLHPMVIMGVVLGAITYFVQGSERWDGSHVATSMVMLAMLLNLFLIPMAPGAAADVRGNSEMYPLNGPNWSLFFEYIGNILYALFIRRLSTRWLAVLVALAGAGLAGYAIGNGSGYGHLGVGWSLAGTNFPGGMLRLLFAFSAGLLMSRVFKPVHIRGAFWLCSLAVVVLLCMPHVGADCTTRCASSSSSPCWCGWARRARPRIAARGASASSAETFPIRYTWCTIPSCTCSTPGCGAERRRYPSRRHGRPRCWCSSAASP